MNFSNLVSWMEIIFFEVIISFGYRNIFSLPWLFEFSTKIFHKIIFLFAATSFHIQQKNLEGKYRSMKSQVNWEQIKIQKKPLARNVLT